MLLFNFAVKVFIFDNTVVEVVDLSESDESDFETKDPADKHQASVQGKYCENFIIYCIRSNTYMITRVMLKCNVLIANKHHHLEYTQQVTQKKLVSPETPKQAPVKRKRGRPALGKENSANTPKDSFAKKKRGRPVKQKSNQESKKVEPQKSPEKTAVSLSTSKMKPPSVINIASRIKKSPVKSIKMDTKIEQITSLKPASLVIPSCTKMPALIAWLESHHIHANRIMKSKCKRNWLT